MNNDQPNPDQIFTPFTPAENLPLEQPAKPERQKRRRVAKVAKPKVARRQRRAAPAPESPIESPLIPVSASLLSTLLGIKPEDMKVFEKLAGILNAAGQGQRQRVLHALSKIF